MAHVEFALVVEEGLFDILLNNPRAHRHRLRMQKLLNVLQILINLYAPPLIPILGLNQPNILRAMLHRRPLFPRIAFRDVLESVDKRIKTIFR